MLEDKIYQDYLSALKERNKHKIDFLSFIRAGLQNAAFDLRKEKLEDNEVLAVLNKQKKRLEETKQNIGLSGRADLLENAEKELALLNAYLPKPLEENELIGIITQAISGLNATSVKDMGKVMKEVMAKVGVQADAKKVSDLVRAKLASG